MVTYVVQNSLDENYLDGAFEWEEAFVNYMKGVAADPKYADLRISFYSEVFFTFSCSFFNFVVSL